MTLTIFRAGNSDVVAIPKELKDKYGLHSGRKVDVKDSGKGVYIEPLTDKPTVSTEFTQWLEAFEKKYDKALTELAKL